MGPGGMKWENGKDRGESKDNRGGNRNGFVYEGGRGGGDGAGRWVGRGRNEKQEGERKRRPFFSLSSGPEILYCSDAPPGQCS